MAHPFLPVLWLWLSAELSFVSSGASSALRQTAHLERKEINVSDNSNFQKKKKLNALISGTTHSLALGREPFGLPFLASGLSWRYT